MKTLVVKLAVGALPSESRSPARFVKGQVCMMMWHPSLGKAASTVVTGVVGVAAYEVLRKAVKATPIREATVMATSWGLRGVRKAEEGAEHARLAVGDVVAEARGRIGEEVSPPTGEETDHGHNH